MTKAITVTVTSSLHGDRTFRLLRYKPYQRRDGTETTLAVWEGVCVICGAAFEAATPKDVTEPHHSKTFQMTTCTTHRLTLSEVGRLRLAKASERPNLFQHIKADKIAQPNKPRLNPRSA